MSTLKHKFLKPVLFFVTGFVLLFIVFQWRAKYMVEDFLQRKIPKHLELSYDDLSVNILSGSVAFEKVSLKILNRGTDDFHTSFYTKRLELENFGYVQFFFNSTISLDELKFKEPRLKYYPYKYVPAKKNKPQGVVNLLKTIDIQKLALEHGSFYLMKADKDSIAVALESYNFELLGGKIDPKLITQKIPISYSSYTFDGTNIFADLGVYESVNVGKLKAKENNFRIDEVKLVSKYEKQELSKHLEVERDYVKLIVPQIEMENFDFGFEQDRFGITVASAKIVAPHLELYRDKGVLDNTTIKSLYSKSLRELPINLKVESVEIDKGYISYEERTNDEQAAGLLFFDNLNANISKISNSGGVDLNTELEFSTKLMGEGDLTLNWSFDVADINDSFIASGSLKNFQADNMNPFLEPNLRTRAVGGIEEMYFTFSGNSINSQGDLKMKYSDFEFQILNKDRTGINKFLSKVGNLFINDGSETDAQGFRHGTTEVERATDKSFFNYLWINIQDGMLTTLTGNGKKRG